MKERLIKCLDLLKQEVNKRNKIYKYGVDLINYENNYSTVAIDLIVFSLFLMNKKRERSEEVIKDQINWWLYEKVKKRYWINKKEYNVEKAKDFVEFLLKF